MAIPANTERAEAITRFIIDFKERNNGNSPSIREIGDALNISSTSVVQYHIDALVRKGIIYRTDGVSRGYGIPGSIWVRPKEEEEVNG